MLNCILHNCSEYAKVELENNKPAIFIAGETIFKCGKGDLKDALS